MASLMKKLFDTMPLNGVRGALNNVAGSLRQADVGQLSEQLQFLEVLPAFRVTAQQPRPGSASPPDATNIWSYDVDGDPARVQQVGCRVRSDQFNQYLVLEQLEWGHAAPDDPTTFLPTVGVVLDGVPIQLPLTEEFRLMTFMALSGENAGFAHKFWPLDAKYDPSLLHVFVYDLQRASGDLVSLTSLAHPDREAIDEMIVGLKRLTGGRTVDDENAEDFLFRDNLWDASLGSGSPQGTVPEVVELSLRPIRVVVACSLTVCREKSDYQPGRPGGVARIYPHIMVACTAKLDRVDAGVRFTRPKAMTLLDGVTCGCGEMLSDMGALLVADSNANAMVLDNANAPVLGPAPHVYWANLFNYYVIDPFTDPELRNRAMPIVRRSKTTARDSFGMVDRDCSDYLFTVNQSNTSRVTKAPRQGWFDNIHVAPKMQVHDKIARFAIPGLASLAGLPGLEVTESFVSNADWRMDAVVMAPFCPHDCFHMHWRWSDNANNESHTYGWGPTAPHQEVGRVMIPENQDAFLVITSDSQFSYLAQAHDVNVSAWQVFCHHGAGYAVSAGSKMDLARLSTRTMSRGDFENVLGFPVLGNWALFFWRNRFEFVDNGSGASPRLVVKERFSFTQRMQALDL